MAAELEKDSLIIGNLDSLFAYALLHSQLLISVPGSSLGNVSSSMFFAHLHFSSVHWPLKPKDDDVY